MISHVEPSRELIAGRRGTGGEGVALPEIPLLDVGADWPTSVLDSTLRSPGGGASTLAAVG
jgi:hypothetical protein